MRGRHDLDAVILGTGPAAAALAWHLRRQGATVALVGSDRRPAPRPREVIAPPTLRELRAIGLASMFEGAVSCRGLLTNWHGVDEFHDYALLQCEAGLCVEPEQLQRELCEVALACGAHLVHATSWTVSGLDSGRWQVEVQASGGSTLLQGDALFVATGRSFPSGLRALSTRHFMDRQVAWQLPVRRSPRHGDALVIEASANGWWYAPPRAGDDDAIVFLTDSDLLPRGAQKRAELVERELRSTRLISQCVEDVRGGRTLRGCDTRFSFSDPCPADACVAVGDTVLALDPLSGRGISFALESARRAATAVGCTGASIQGSYRDWVGQRIMSESIDRLASYGRARLPEAASPYWGRRRSSMSHMPAPVLTQS